MHHPIRILLIAMLCGQLAAPARGGLFDWGRKPTVVYQPVIVGCGARTVVNYTPHTVYATSWVRVPVTTYRPVATTDPATCSRVSYMQPTTSYVWQAQRRPHVIYRPFLTHVANCCGCGGSCPGSSPAFLTTPQTTGASATQAPLVTAPGAAPGDAIPTYPSSPYPASPYSSTTPYPGVSPYSGATPYPGAAPPATTAPPAGSGVPADQPPRLDPGSVTPPTSTQRPGLPQAGMSPVAPNVPAAPPLIRSTPPAESPAPSSPSPSTPAPSRRKADPSVQPVPDPDAAGSGPNDADGGGGQPAWNPPFSTPSVPRLLNPSDRTASLRPRVVAPVSWPVPSAPPREIRQPPRPERFLPAGEVDDSGWRPAY